MAGAMMAYSPSDNLFLLFGGWNGDTFNGTWVLDPKAEAWTQLHPRVSPPARGDGMLVYDPQAGAFILFGGWYETSTETYYRYGDTWAFYVNNGTWVERHPRVAPSPRSDSAIADDPVDGVTLLFGGFDGTAYLGDMWAYAFRDDSWTPLASTVMPSPRADGRMVYDVHQGAFFIFAGNDYSGPNFTFHHLADMWRYDWGANRWSQVFIEVNPGARDYPVFASDPKSGELLLTGGFGNRTILGDTWAFNTTRITWRNITTLPSPPPRMAAVGGYDSQDDILVVFSGGDNAGAKADTWFFRYPPPLFGAILLSSAAPVAGQAITFLVSIQGGSGVLTRETWQFGDGGTASGSTASHAFNRPGLFRVVFEAEDDRGHHLLVTLDVAVGVLFPLWVDLTALALGLGAVAVALLVRVKPFHRKVKGPGGGSPTDDRRGPGPT